MAIPKIFHAVQPQDFTLNTIVTHKRFQLESGSVATTASGYYLWNAIYTGTPTPIGTAKASNDPTNSIDNSYQAIIWKSIDAQYYRFPYDRYATLEHSNERFTQKFLNISASVLQMPYFDFGEGIKPGSLHMTNSFYGLNLRDDKNGNIYDVSIDTGSFTNRYDLVAYWSFDNEFRKFKVLKNLQHDYLALNSILDANILAYSSVAYKSRTFQPDQTSIAKNIRIAEGVHNTSGTSSGFSAYFDSTSYLLTPNRDEFNFAQNEDFTIAFWMHAFDFAQNDTNLEYNQIISKKGTIYKQTYGKQKKYQNDIVVETDYVSSSYWDESTNVYPYDFRFFNDTSARNNIVEFRRSDGINICTLSGSKAGSWTHVAVTKSGSLMSMYINGSVTQTTTDRTDHCLNQHSLIFGTDNRNFNAAFTGYIDEVRFYERAYPLSTIQTLAASGSQALYQTAVVGNVFYRSGKIVLSPLDPKYSNFFTQNWNLKYRGTHTIYEYETLVRLKKGSFNLTQNPTARLSPKSEFLINELTGSALTDSGAMPTYCTGIGLYNDKKELMAVAKLGQPLAMREDVDINIIIRFDA